MDSLNQKLNSSFDKNQDRALVSGMYGFNTTSGKWNYIEENGSGALSVDVHGGSIGSGDVKARTNPADASSSQFLKCNANNHLKTQIIGFDGSEFRDLKCDTEGKLMTEITAEIQAEGLAQESKQDTMIANQTNGTQQTICLGNNSGVDNKPILVSATGVVQVLDSEVFGKTSQIANQTTLSNTNEATLIAQGNRAGIGVGNTSADGSGTNTALLTDAQGHLQVDVLSSGTLTISGDAQIKGEDDSGSARNIRCNNSGHVKSMGHANTVGDGSGTNKVVMCNDAGQLKVQLIGEDNTATRRAVRTNTVGHIQTALLGNTAGDGSGTIKNVLTDTDGHLQVDVLSGGGGGTQFASGSTLGGTPTGTLLIGSNSGTAKEVSVNSSGDLTVKADITNTTLAITASALPLPTGGATSALQTTGNTSLASVDGKITACNTGAVVVSSSALPSGGSTSALQTTGNTSLASVDGKITACNTGAVVVSSSALPTGGATSALQTTGNTSLSNIESHTGSIEGCVVSNKLQVDNFTSNLYDSQITNVLKPSTGGDPPVATAGANIDLTKVKSLSIVLTTTDSTASGTVGGALEFSEDGSNFFTNISSSSLSWSVPSDVLGQARQRGGSDLYTATIFADDTHTARFARIIYTHSNGSGANISITAQIVKVPF